MSPKNAFFAAAVISIAATIGAAPAFGIESGTYYTKGSDAKLLAVVKKKTALLQLAGDRCLGEIGGKLSKSGSNAWKVNATEGCVLQIKKQGKSYQLLESGCTGFHGPSCTFSGLWSK